MFLPKVLQCGTDNRPDRNQNAHILFREHLEHRRTYWGQRRLAKLLPIGANDVLTKSTSVRHRQPPGPQPECPHPLPGAP